jgi:hypothetical protein
MGVIPLFDADRPYPRLFEQIPVLRLLTSGEGKTVNEDLIGEERAKPASRLRDEIVSRLSPFLLAPIVAKTERQKEVELVVRRLKERFDVKVSERLVVSFSLIANPSLCRTVDFSKFYLRRRVVPGTGAVEEAQYTLYVVGSEKDSLASLDADALGQAIAPIFFADRVSEDIAGLFSRIAYRYQQTNGNLDELQEFLLYHLGISREAQDMARALMLGEAGEIGKGVTAPPPLITVPLKPQENLNMPQTIRQTVDKHQEILGQKLSDIVRRFAPSGSGEGQVPSGAGSQEGRAASMRPSVRITVEQQNRGKRGEAEIKRRLQLPGGWEGFTLVADKTKEDCGYDFLCAVSGRQVKLEVKTFTIDGRVFVGSAELQAAAANQDDYYLVGVLDDGKPEYEWRTFLIPNPISTLLGRGEFDVEATLHAQASEIFPVMGENSRAFC